MRPGQDDIEMACSSVIYKRGKLRATVLQFTLFFSLIFLSLSPGHLLASLARHLFANHELIMLLLRVERQSACDTYYLLK